MIELELLDHLPIDRQAVFDRIRGGCSPDIIKYLVAHFWAKDETDPNVDLGFVFALKDELNSDVIIKLYLSCVISYAALRIYKVEGQHEYSNSIAANERDVVASGKLSRLVKHLTERGVNILYEDSLSEKPSSKILLKNGEKNSKLSYFELIFERND